MNIEIKQQIGTLLLIIIMYYWIYFIKRYNEKGYEWYIPLGAAIIVWAFLEAAYLVITQFIIT